MNILLCEIQSSLPPGMSVPDPLRLLFDWMEQNRLNIDRSGRCIGFLYPLEKLQASWTDEEREGGTFIEFAADDTPYFVGNRSGGGLRAASRRATQGA
jgi:hypothetical protein